MTDIAPGRRVQHRLTGDVGELRQVQRDLWQEWALVRWDGGGPGMCNELGLSYVAPGLLTSADPDS